VRRDALTEYVLLSDVHLTEIVTSRRAGWWEYKSPAASQEDDLVSFLAAVEAFRPAQFETTHLVFTGDTFDFDSVFSAPEGEVAPRDGLPSDVPGSVYKLGRILDGHPRFVAALAGFLGRGGRATFLMGNHDRELAFAEVEELLRQRVSRAAPVGQASRVAERLAVEPWFFHVPGVLYAEHGQQYDTTCSYRDVLWPFLPATRTHGVEIEPSFGSVFGRKILSQLGTFNPFNDESFILSLGGYLRHFARYYWPHRALFRPYFRAGLGALRDARRRRREALRARRDTSDLYRAYARRAGVDDGFVRLLLRLSSPPLADQLVPLIRELWLDRWALILLLVTLLVVGIVNVHTWTQAALLLLLLPVATVGFRMLGRGSLALQERARWGLVAEQISSHLHVPVIAFGHSHRPERRPLADGGRYYNLGSWAPVLESDRETTLGRARRFLVVRAVRPGRVHVAFQRWDRGHVAPY